jgi:hypothetical protein
MSCLKNGVVANVVVPHPDYVRFAAHYGFRPDFCESADPESKGVVEHLAGYGQVDLVVPEGGFGGKPEVGNRQARIWGLVWTITQLTPGTITELTPLEPTSAYPHRACPSPVVTGGQHLLHVA